MPHLVNGRLRSRPKRVSPPREKTPGGFTKPAKTNTGHTVTVSAEERAKYEAIARAMDERAKYEQHLPQDNRRR